MKQAKTISIFLASSIKELKDERKDLSDNITGDISNLLSRDNIYIHFEKCESNHSGNDGTRDQKHYNLLLQNCDFSVFLFKTHLGDRTEEEFAIARQLQKTQKHVVFVYFLQVPEGEKEKKLIDFQTRLDIDWKECATLSDVKYSFALGLLDRLGIRVDMPKTLDERFSQYKMIGQKLHEDIEDILAQIEQIKTIPSESVVAMVMRVLSLYREVDRIASATNYDRDKYLQILAEYGDFLYKYGIYGDAEIIYLRNLDLVKELFGEKNSRIALTYSKIGAVYDCMKSYEKAFQYHQLALKTRIIVLGRNDLDTADSYIHKGILYSELNRNMIAIWFFYKALRIRKKLLGKNNSSLSRDYNNIGWLFCIQDMYKLALFSLHKATQLVDDTDLTTTSYIFNNIGFAYMCINSNKEALDYLNRSIAIREKNLGTEHPDTAESYINIGYLYEKMKNDETSIKYYKKALKLLPERIKPIHHRICNSNNWKRVTSELGIENAFTYLKKNWGRK